MRDWAALEGVSCATAVRAFGWLEDKGLAFAKPKSGYFVSKSMPRTVPVAAPAQCAPQNQSCARIDQLHGPGGVHITANLGGTCPRDSDLFDEDRVRRAMSRAARLQRRSLIEYSNAAGTSALQMAVVQRAMHLGCSLHSPDIVVVSSCIQAIGLCLRAVTQPGDAVAIESPTFFGFLDVLDALGLRAVEIPSHPKTGLSLPALQLALDTQPIKAVLAVPTLSNPQGAVMSLADKKTLVQMLAAQRVPLIEDVVFNDLLASDRRRRAAKSFDKEGGVMVCGSFSKTLTPGVRLGWVDAGRWRHEVAMQKRVQGMATNVVIEHALADLLTQSAYEAQLRKLSARMKSRLKQARQLVLAHFPSGTRASDPPAGYTLWIELPVGSSATQLFELAANEGILIGPGHLFSASPRFAHCVRLSFSGAWTQVQKDALVRLGQLAHALR